MDSKFRNRAFYGLTIVGVLVLLIFVPLNIIRNVPQLSIGNIIFCIILIVNAIFFAKHGRIEIAGMVGAIGVILFTTIYLMVLGLPMYFWIYITPLSAFLILGKRTGSAVIVFSAVIYITIFFFIPDNSPHTFWLEFDLFASYLFCTLMAYLTRHINDLDRAELDRISSTDVLTGAMNRRKFEEIFHRELSLARRHEESLSLIVFDIDFFKRINDNHGHHKGDQILVQLSQLVQAELRSEDYFFRWGGEEFLVLLPFTNLHKAEYLAERLRSIIEKNDFAHHEQVTASFGVTQFQQSELSAGTAGTSIKTVEYLIQQADRALYRSKNSGRNKVEVHHLYD